ncbi:hypothetical protein DFS34DRAFT_165589 [Phlyctochytrium arcticum]|nr:hypothetical protein DFS34DRAFT_165589 [Phlyctochytrium arcticum]
MYYGHSRLAEMFNTVALYLGLDKKVLLFPPVIVYRTITITCCWSITDREWAVNKLAVHVWVQNLASKITKLLYKKLITTPNDHFYLIKPYQNSLAASRRYVHYTDFCIPVATVSFVASHHSDSCFMTFSCTSPISKRSSLAAEGVFFLVYSRICTLNIFIRSNDGLHVSQTSYTLKSSRISGEIGSTSVWDDDGRESFVLTILTRYMHIWST